MVDISEELVVCSAIKVKQSFQRLWGLIKIPVKSKDWLFDFVLCLKWERF